MLRTYISRNSVVAYYILIVFLICIVFFSIPKGEEVYFINGLHTPFLDFFFSTITHFGNAIYFIPAVLVMMFFQFRYSLMLTMTGLAHGVIVTIFKRLIFSHAGRPITYLDADLLHQVPGVSIHKWMSFPSGHTATIFAFIVLLSLLFKNRWITFLLSLIAILAGLSRIYLLQHFGVDVAVGAFIGTLTSVISYLTLHSASQPVWLVNKLSLSKFSSRKSMLMNTLRQRLNL